MNNAIGTIYVVGSMACMYSCVARAVLSPSLTHIVGSVA